MGFNALFRLVKKRVNLENSKCIRTYPLFVTFIEPPPGADTSSLQLIWIQYNSPVITTIVDDK